MADISREIQAFREAVYGEEVRGSMIGLCEKVNLEVESSTERSQSAESAAVTAQDSATASAKLSESWAVGGTSSRQGEDTNNSKFYSLRAETLVGDATTVLRDAQVVLESATKKLSSIEFELREDGHLYYKTDNTDITFRINPDNGHLEFMIQEGGR